jgi:hypothetical protein
MQKYFGLVVDKCSHTALASVVFGWELRNNPPMLVSKATSSKDKQHQFNAPCVPRKYLRVLPRR